MSSSFRVHRVLCITLRSGSVGHAVLDGFGVAEGSFFTSRLDHLQPSLRYQKLLRLLRSSCRRFRPTRIVFGLPGPVRADRLALATRLSRRLRSQDVAVSVKRLCHAARLLVERFRYTMAHDVVERLAAHFVPSLTSFVDRDHANPRYWRAAWYAVAVALATLVEHHPYDAAALAQPSAFSLRPFRDALRSSLTPSRPYAP